MTEKLKVELSLAICLPRMIKAIKAGIVPGALPKEEHKYGHCANIYPNGMRCIMAAAYPKEMQDVLVENGHKYSTLNLLFKSDAYEIRTPPDEDHILSHIQRVHDAIVRSWDEPYNPLPGLPDLPDLQEDGALEQHIRDIAAQFNVELPA